MGEVALHYIKKAQEQYHPGSIYARHFPISNIIKNTVIELISFRTLPNSILQRLYLEQGRWLHTGRKTVPSIFWQ